MFFFVYIETTVTICCHGVPLSPIFYCFEIRGKENSGGSSIIFTLPESWGKDIQEIEITESSIEDFDGIKMKIKKGKYMVSKNNKVFLDLEYL